MSESVSASDATPTPADYAPPTGKASVSTATLIVLVVAGIILLGVGVFGYLALGRHRRLRDEPRQRSSSRSRAREQERRRRRNRDEDYDLERAQQRTRRPRERSRSRELTLRERAAEAELAVDSGKTLVNENAPSSAYVVEPRRGTRTPSTQPPSEVDERPGTRGARSASLDREGDETGASSVVGRRSQSALSKRTGEDETTDHEGARSRPSGSTEAGSTHGGGGTRGLRGKASAGTLDPGPSDAASSTSRA